ncbi:unnamed protein product [Protopolystoma xenopodis]|uniref:Uncharacterized protein n=1 Tax=Protopolystoma xenopodis TaxID=117903 RepID=A0A448WRR5_9PLAT|nr:unnamed protein product [Protopolystoma xenopodis]
MVTMTTSREFEPSHGPLKQKSRLGAGQHSSSSAFSDLWFVGPRSVSRSYVLEEE